MNIIFELGTLNDIDELEELYNDLNDHLSKGINYPGWKRDVYPIREDAINGINNKNLFIAKHNDEIVGTVILNHKPEPAYAEAKWAFESDYTDVFVIHTFAVNPKYLNHGIGKALMEFCIQYSTDLKARAIRLDVYEGNIPAINIYEKYGFNYVDTVDLGFGEYGLHWYKLYEKLL